MLLVLFEGFAIIVYFIGFSPSRICCVSVYLRDNFAIKIAVLPGQPF